jgi:VWFA-related protein
MARGLFQLKKMALAGSLALTMLGVQAQPQAAQQSTTQQAIPDAPRAQPIIPGLGSVTPGQGSASSSDTGPVAPAPAPANRTAAPPPQMTQPAIAPEDLHQFTLPPIEVNYVEIPFTVKDSKGNMVAGLLPPRDIEVFENGVKQHITDFTNDAWPLSVAVVIDQSMTFDNMTRVNDALGALQDAFSKYDEIAIFTYNKSTTMVTDFTGAQSTRLTQAVVVAKGSGREPVLAGDLGGPISCTTCINGQNVDPNTAASRGSSSIMVNAPREIHPLNDAILKAAVSLSTKPRERRRVIYVISDGKEYGSQAKTKDVIKYLQRNRIEVDGTLVGDSAIPVVGLLDHLHLPLMMRDNVLLAYRDATGGNFDSEFRIPSIEKSFARIAAEVRNRYTLGYYTPETFLDGKYRTVEVVVTGHGNDLTVLAKKGYWPWAMELAPHAETAPQ